MKPTYKASRIEARTGTVQGESWTSYTSLQAARDWASKQTLAVVRLTFDRFGEYVEHWSRGVIVQSNAR